MKLQNTTEKKKKIFSTEQQNDLVVIELLKNYKELRN